MNTDNYDTGVAPRRPSAAKWIGTAAALILISLASLYYLIAWANNFITTPNAAINFRLLFLRFGYYGYILYDLVIFFSAVLLSAHIAKGGSSGKRQLLAGIAYLLLVLGSVLNALRYFKHQLTMHHLFACIFFVAAALFIIADILMICGLRFKPFAIAASSVFCALLIYASIYQLIDTVAHYNRISGMSNEGYFQGFASLLFNLMFGAGLILFSICCLDPAPKDQKICSKRS